MCFFLVSDDTTHQCEYCSFFWLLQLQTKLLFKPMSSSNLKGSDTYVVLHIGVQNQPENNHPPRKNCSFPAVLYGPVAKCEKPSAYSMPSSCNYESEETFWQLQFLPLAERNYRIEWWQNGWKTRPRNINTNTTDSTNREGAAHNLVLLNKPL